MADINDYNLKYTDECLRDKYIERSELSNFKTDDLKTYELENGILLPLKNSAFNPEKLQGGLSQEDGKMFEPCRCLPNRLINPYDFDKECLQFDDREVVYAGVFWEHWGHFILEQVSRLYYFLDEKNKSLPIIYSGKKPLSGVYLEFFELMGIDTKRLLWIDKPTKFKKIFVPEVSLSARAYYTKEYKKIFDTVKSKVEALDVPVEKILYSTRNFVKTKSKDFGEIKEIEDFFVQNGYKLISPEQKTLQEQIALMKSCKEFVSISGTLPHNLLFANKDINAIILNKSYILNFEQFLIDDVTNIRPLYIDAHLSLLPANIGVGPFFFWFSDKLIKYAQDHNMVLNVKNEQGYLKKFIFNYIRYHRENLLKSLFLNNSKIYDCYWRRFRKNTFLTQLIFLLLKTLCFISVSIFILNYKKNLYLF